MASHLKSHIFIRITTSNKTVVCINPQHVSSFQISEKAKVKVKKDNEVEIVEADTIHFYFPSGTGLSYSVGVSITQDEFNYVCTTLSEYIYLNEYEHKSRSEAIEKAKMQDWNKLSEQNEEKIILPKE